MGEIIPTKRRRTWAWSRYVALDLGRAHPDHHSAGVVLAQLGTRGRVNDQGLQRQSIGRRDSKSWPSMSPNHRMKAMQHRGSKPELEPFGATGEENFRAGLSEADSPVLDSVARGRPRMRAADISMLRAGFWALSPIKSTCRSIRLRSGLSLSDTFRLTAGLSLFINQGRPRAG